PFSAFSCITAGSPIDHNRVKGRAGVPFTVKDAGRDNAIQAVKVTRRGGIAILQHPTKGLQDNFSSYDRTEMQVGGDGATVKHEAVRQVFAIFAVIIEADRAATVAQMPK